MRKLTENQKKFLRKQFFEISGYENWVTIANNLLDNGSCIVAGSECIWKGGIGNFINTKPVENAVGCLLYEFKLETFLSSNWYVNSRNNYVSNLTDTIKQKQSELEDVESLDFYN
jgi:hypothetical protein